MDFLRSCHRRGAGSRNKRNHISGNTSVRAKTGHIFILVTSESAGLVPGTIIATCANTEKLCYLACRNGASPRSVIWYLTENSKFACHFTNFRKAVTKIGKIHITSVG